ncbi:MAG: tRNA uridine(34) 5-carboxymethylaminomethyl modification radical SAM/GNAT enzyme Elp3 [Chloroflexi bacterium]|nr:tRNA uridine(34) 5-carboxymethylaminomethyl modification radical SAM/GNAT enzyme Elp3 [Chloroflexota bacterium]
MASERDDLRLNTRRKDRRYIFEPKGRGTSKAQQAEWQARNEALDIDDYHDVILHYVEQVKAAEFKSGYYGQLTRRLSREGWPIISKARLRQAYLAMVDRGRVERDEEFLRRLTLKPTRTLSGIAPVTVFTKPFPCPGKCIFCPTDVKMPKSYLSNEPGAMRALILEFDPYEQVARRIEAMEKIGHTVNKVELIIAGGTWSAYEPDYQEWFVQRCFEAMNGAEVATLEEAQRQNETARYRNTGLVIETRPDHITVEEVRRLRRLGVTRVQMGVQSLDDQISFLNKRGETAADVRQAMRLLRGAGFKIALHWMPNLLGATAESDRADFLRFWNDPAIQPDEMKIYPTGLLNGTELYDHYERGEYEPYSEDDLADLLRFCMQQTPETCRLNRVMRDIPAPDIVEGVTRSNLRELVERDLRDAGTPCRCIRCREIRGETVDADQIEFKTIRYATDHSEEVFISAVTPDDKLAGFLRLSLPTLPAPFTEIAEHAMIRQVQVYGPALALSEASSGQAQHQGLGTRLVEASLDMAREAGFAHISVISAVGTRAYYRRHGFERGDLYMSRAL